MTSLIDSMIMSAPTNTQGKAKIKICPACFLKTYQSELKELSKMSGGKKMRRIPRGSMPDVAVIESPTIPRCPENLPMSMLVMKRVGVNGMKLHTFCKLLMTIATVNEKNKKNSTNASVVMYPLIISVYI